MSRKVLLTTKYTKDDTRGTRKGKEKKNASFPLLQTPLIGFKPILNIKKGIKTRKSTWLRSILTPSS